MTGGKAKTGGANVFSKASIRLVFQKRPGSGVIHRIKDGGPATVIFRSGKTIALTPADGVYSLEVSKGDSAVLEIFSTQFSIHALASGDPDPGGIVSWRSPLLPKSTLKGVQQRLQILGYYTGRVDGALGAKTERAVLEFQADEGSLKIDGEAGPKTQAALDAYIEKNGKDSSGKHYLIRRYLLRFERANTGATRWDGPQLDFRGGGVPVLGFGVEVGLVSSLFKYLGIGEKSFQVGMSPEGLDATAFPFFVGVKSKSSSVLVAQSTRLVGTPDRIKLLPKGEGRETVEIRHQKQDGPILGEFNIRCAALKQVDVAAHILDIRQIGTLTAIASPSNWTRADIEKLMAGVNAIWIAAGIEFRLRSVESHEIRASQPGQISDNYVTGNIESISVWNLFNKIGRVNMYFSQKLVMTSQDPNGVTKISDPLGFAADRPHHGRVGVCIRKDLNANAAVQARVVAHELGHVLQITPAPKRHSDDDGTDDPWRNDIWSRMRLMAKYVGYYKNSFGNQPWQDTTYGTDSGGAMNAGDLITVKNFGMDDSDGEFEIARNAAQNPY